MSSSSGERPGPGAGRLRLGLALLAAAGALLGVLPHLIALARSGDFAHIADMDDLLYLAWSRDAVLHGRARLVDAVHRASGPMMHPWLLFVPPAALARALGLGMTGLGVAWRALAGAGIALGLYAATRPAARGPGAALAAAALLTFDAGLLYGQPFARELLVLASLLRGCDEYLARTPAILAHLRVVTPGLAIPVLLLHYALALRARIDGGTRPALAAAASLGLLFYAYFYFWTAALLGAALAWLLDPRGRRTLALILLPGVAIGAPALAWSFAIKASTPPDWLARTDKFVPIGHLEDLLRPDALIVAWALSGLPVFRWRRELTYPWCVVGAGLACANHQIVTGLQVENYHWVQITGLTFSLLLALLVAPSLGGRLARSRGARAALAASLAAQAGLGLYLRAEEGLRTRETRAWMRNYRDYRRDRSAWGSALPPGAVVGGDGAFTFLGAALDDLYPLAGRLVDFSSRATDEELDERLTLNLFLMGIDRATARTWALGRPGLAEGWWESYAARPGPATDRRRVRRLALIDRIWGEPGPGPLLRKYEVSHVVVRASSAAGPIERLARRSARGVTWDLWELPPRPASRPTSSRGLPPGNFAGAPAIFPLHPMHQTIRMSTSTRT